jgi:hypothetical protein
MKFRPIALIVTPRRSNAARGEGRESKTVAVLSRFPLKGFLAFHL